MSGTDYRAVARDMAHRHGIDPQVFERQIHAESLFDPRALSPSGAQGIAQIMPRTAELWGVDPWDPVAALDAAAWAMGRYLRDLGSYRLALAAYHAGPQAAWRALEEVPATRTYVAGILPAGEPRGEPATATDDAAPRDSQPATGPEPAISVVVLSYQSRERIDVALSSLAAQELAEPYEVIVVDSGGDGTDARVRQHYPWVRLVTSERRLLPGAARNRGVAAARAPYVAFLADDCSVTSDWLARRLAKHREGFEAVGGAVVNGTRWHPLGSAGYYLEYTAVIPSERVLAEQSIPHGLSYARTLLDRIGPFPEDMRAGEDTVLNRRCVGSGASIGFDPEVRMTHRNLTSVRAYLAHQHQHGRALVQALVLQGIRSHAFSGRRRSEGLFAAYFRYPGRRWRAGLARLARGRPGAVPAYFMLSPLIWMGLWAASAGGRAESRRVWAEARAPGLRAVEEPTAG